MITPTRFALVVVTVAALASGGARAAAYYIGEFGAKSLARGGANVVDPEDPSAAWLNPAAITLATGPQLQLDLNLVWLHSSFTRDCGGTKNGCAPLEKVKRSYADGDHKYEVTGKRKLGGDTRSADTGQLGDINTPASQFDGKTAVENEAGVQPIPRGYLSFNLDSFGLDGFAAGIYVTAPNAGDYKFGEDAVTRYSLIDRDLLEVFYGVVLGYRFDNWIGVGASLQGVSSGLDQTIALSGDQFGNEDPGYDIIAHIQASENFIPSANFGLWSNPLKPLGIGDLEIGASVQLPRFVTATGPIKIVKFGKRIQDEYLDPPGGDPPVITLTKSGTATASFVLPPIYRLGLKYGMDDVLHDGSKLFGFDVELAGVYEAWSTYDHVYLKTKGIKVDFTPSDGKPGKELDPITQPKDWQNAFSVRLGGSAKFLDELVAVHGGAFYESSAIPNETYDIELVCGDKLGLGTGVTAKLFGVALTAAYSHVFIADRTVGQESIVFLGNSGDSIFTSGETKTRVAMGKYSASYDMLEFSLNVAFDEMFGFGVHSRPSAADDAMPPPTAAPDAPAPAAPPAAAPAPDAPPAPDAAPAPAPDAPAPSSAPAPGVALSAGSATASGAGL